jgi:hypothetical protein
MRKTKIETYYINYRTSDKEIYFIQCIKKCKFPYLTKEYKRLRIMLDMDLIKGVGYCSEKYYLENKYQFINNYI